jgi:hypothetical protein
MCASLPGWIAQVEQEETSKGIPSAQFWKELRASLALDCIIGCSPLVAPSSFPMAQSGQGEGWGFNLPPPSRIIYNLLHLSAPEQWHVCQSLRADKCWYALTRGSTLDRCTIERLISVGMVLRFFRRGTRAAAAKGLLAPSQAENSENRSRLDPLVQQSCCWLRSLSRAAEAAPWLHPPHRRWGRPP